MRARFFLATLLLIAIAACSSEKDQGLNGTYVGSQNFGIGQVSSTIQIQLSQKGTALTGSVTPPFQTLHVPISNGSVSGSQFQFDAKQGDFTFRYEGILRTTSESGASENILEGNFGPLGCINSTLGEPCPSDSNGTFTATKQ